MYMSGVGASSKHHKKRNGVRQTNTSEEFKAVFVEEETYKEIMKGEAENTGLVAAVGDLDLGLKHTFILLAAAVTNPGPRVPGSSGS